jgi:predicted Zn-dependent protease
VDTLNLAWVLAGCPVDSLRDPKRAYELARRAWESLPKKNPNAQIILAAACNATGRHEEAVRSLRPITESAPANAVDLWNHWAIAHHHLGRPEPARRALGKVAQWVRGGGVPLLDQQIQLRQVNELLGNPEPSLMFPPPATAAEQK